MKNKGLRHFEFLPLSIRIETKGGIGSPLVLRGTPLPTKRSQVFSTATDNQPGVEVKIGLGESPLFASNILFGTMYLNGIPPAKQGVPQIKVEFSVDESCCITAKASISGTDLSAQNELRPPVPLTDEFLKGAIVAAEASRASDEEFLRRIEARDRAGSLIASAERQLETGFDSGLSAAIAELGLSLASGASGDIRAQSDKLEALLKLRPDPFDIFREVFQPRASPSTPVSEHVTGEETSRPRDKTLPAEVSASVGGHALGKVFGGGTFTLDPQLCFVLMPFAKELQPVYDDHIRPTIERAQLRCERADEIQSPTLIT
jgi:hypothetical protein